MIIIHNNLVILDTNHTFQNSNFNYGHSLHKLYV